jgi:hypothetical protein
MRSATSLDRPYAVDLADGRIGMAKLTIGMTVTREAQAVYFTYDLVGSQRWWSSFGLCPRLCSNPFRYFGRCPPLCAPQPDHQQERG